MRVANDLDKLAPMCSKEFPEEVDETHGRGDVLGSVEVVRACSSSSRLSSAAVRAARRAIHKAVAKPRGKSSKCATCLDHYAGPKVAMERARTMAAAGLQDTAADVTCEAIASALETKLALAFISVDKWAVRRQAR